MKKTKTTDALITEADVQAFKDDVNRGVFKDIVYEEMRREPELAIFASDRYCKLLHSLQDAGIEGCRLAAICRHICLMTWGSVILIARSQRRQWEDFLPSMEIADPKSQGGGK